MATTSDGVTIYGEKYFGDLSEGAPLVLLFHQGGSNGRGEYAEIGGWLNEHGYRAIAWDLREGGDLHGSSNRTVANLPDGTEPGYCNADKDLAAALDYVVSNKLADSVVLWGSSYSAALIFQLAADNPEPVAAVVAFSPAAGGPLESCRARMWIQDVKAPMLVLRPESEMELESAVEQQGILEEGGAEFHVVENGRHGSSMLLDTRTGHDMSASRELVINWISNAIDT